MAKYNLIIIHVPGRQQISDFLAVRKMMARRARDIEVHVLTHGSPVAQDFWRRMAERPTAIFSPMPITIPPDIRGARLTANPTRKSREIEMLVRHGFPVPRTEVIRPETVLDEAQWGRFVVVKPEMSYRGQGVKLMRARDVRWADPLSWPEDDPRHGQELIVQRFIETGPFFTCYRVMTVLARPVYSVTSTAIDPLPSFDTLGDAPVELEVAANGVPRRVELVKDEEILALAVDIHRKLAHTPVMGVDVIRELGTGRLYVLELNSGGWTWHLSSDHGRHQQADHGLDYYGQFNALDVIADALIDITRRRAV